MIFYARVQRGESATARCASTEDHQAPYWPAPPPRCYRSVMSTSSEAARSNRLIHETSPYLLQHASNPVDWYPWGPEALQAAKTQNRPILLSVGYSACHWCHVMERES